MPGVPPAVEHVVLSALAKDPSYRFRSVGEFAQALYAASNLIQPLVANSPLLPQAQTPAQLASPVTRVNSDSASDPLATNSESLLAAAKQLPINAAPASARSYSTRGTPVPTPLKQNTRRNASYAAGSILLLALLVGAVFLGTRIDRWTSTSHVPTPALISMGISLSLLAETITISGRYPWESKCSNGRKRGVGKALQENHPTADISRTFPPIAVLPRG
ncbi:MAG TPA: hypothetical protein VGD98_13355 [Ktedonobacteraceae bacterium]